MMPTRIDSAARQFLPDGSAHPLLWATLIVSGFGFSAHGEERLPSWEFQPYVVSYAIMADSSDSAARQAAERLERELPRAVATSIGARWSLRAIPRDIFQNWSATRCGHFSADDWKALAGDHHPDSVHVIQLTGAADGIHGAVHAWEPLFQQVSVSESFVARDPRNLARRVLEDVHRQVRPLALWERQEDESVRLRVRGGAFSVPDPDFPTLRDQERFTPWVVLRDRDLRVQRVQQIPWTLLELTNSVDGRGPARVISGLKYPLGARPRGRVELLAVAVRPRFPSTRIQVVSLSTPPSPLAAQPVLLEDDAAPPTTEPAEPASAIDLHRVQQLTDRAGHLIVSAKEHGPVVWATFQSGEQLLARVPLVPGASSDLRIELPDDTLRLRVEGQLRLLQSDLISAVAERSALMATARLSAKKKNWDDADRRMREIERLPTATSMKERVSGIRVPAIAEARQRKDRLAEARIQRLCDDAEELIQRYLVNDKLALLKEELVEIKATQSEE